MIGERVAVHLNLRTGRFTIAAKCGGNKMADADTVTLEQVTFKVYETTRQYTIRHNRRRVHAYAVGTLVAIDAREDTRELEQVTYNPFRAPTFTSRRDGRPVHNADRVHFADRVGHLS
jgi:hypothetical protein